jgi:hypothetical protein
MWQKQLLIYFHTQSLEVKENKLQEHFARGILPTKRKVLEFTPKPTIAIMASIIRY